MKNKHLAWIWNLWRERPWLIILLFVLTLLSSAVAVAFPYAFKLVLDAVQAVLEDPSRFPNPNVEVDRIVLLFVAIGLASLVAGFYPGIRGAMNSVFEYIVRKKYFAKIMEKDSNFFHAFRSGDVVTRLTDDIYDFPKLSWFLCSGIFRAVESISKVLFCIVAMILIDPKLTLFALIPIPIMILVYYVTSDRIYDTFNKNQEAISAINNQLEMSFSGVRIIKAYAAEEKYRRFFENALDHRFKTEMGVVKLEVVLMMIYQYIDYVAQIAIIFAGGLMAVRGEINVGTFYAFYNYLSMLIYPILDIPQLFVSGKRAFVNMDRLEEMRSFPQIMRALNGIATGGIDRIELKGLGYTYEGREDAALEGVDLAINKGERVCVIGPVGSGKTTLVKLMAGILPPSRGDVFVNGRSLAEYEIASLRARTGYVPQEPLLFSGTVRENVAFGVQSEEPEISDADFAEAVSVAQLSDELASFAEGEKTMIGQRGVSLSGGQKQRLAIARALARKPELLLLDDITASLDASNEERLMHRLDEIAEDITCVIVSHRLSSLQYVDKVLFLDKGGAMAFGKHEELLSNPAYASFISEHFTQKEGTKQA